MSAVVNSQQATVPPLTMEEEGEHFCLATADEPAEVGLTDFAGQTK